MKIQFEGSLECVLAEINNFVSDVAGRKNVLNNDVIIPVRNNKRFTEFEIDFIINNYKKKSIIWIAKKLSRDKTSIYNQLTKLYKKGLSKKNNRVKKI